MIMRRCKIIISAIALIVMCSCGVRNSTFYAPGYISEYYYFERSNVFLLGNAGDDGLSIDFVSYGEDGPSVFDYEKRKKKSNYYNLCCKFGDLYYNQSVTYGSIGEIHNNMYVYADVVTGINMVSDDDWDNEHPRGVLLNDLFCVRAVTIYPYIQSRYEAEEVRTSIDQPLSNFVKTDLRLLTYYQVIKFKHPMPGSSASYLGGHKFLELYTNKFPDNPIQTLHVALTTDEGKTLEYSVELDLR